MIINGSPNSTGWPSSIRIWITVPVRGEGIWFMVFIATCCSTPRGRALAGGGRRVDCGGGRPRRRGRGRLHLACDPHALTLALELDLAQPGLLEQARQLAHEVGIDRGLAFVLALAVAGHGFELLRRAPISAANPSIASA